MICQRRGPDVHIVPLAQPPDRLVRLPGSKSLTNRHLACAALADGDTTLLEVALCDDTDRMLAGLRNLGIRATLDAARREIRVSGGRGFFPEDEASLDAGQAGTAMRFLAALACLGHGRYRIDGSHRMRQRPIGPLVDALVELGAYISYDDIPGYPPLTIEARGLMGGTVSFARPPSSQFVSALLMVAPYAVRDVLIDVRGPLVSRPYVDMTLAVMQALGVETLAEESRFIVPASQRYRGGDFAIAPDASAASYFWAAAAITGGRVGVRGLSRGSVQGDVGFVDVLAQMGCTVEHAADAIIVAGPPRGRLRGVNVDLNTMPDTVQTLAVAALFANTPTTIRNVANLRIKETDRIAALAAELARVGAVVDVQTDGLTVFPPAEISPAEIHTYDDHRMAMSFALAGLVAPGVVIRDAACVSKSFPEFFDVLDTLAAPSAPR
jgi:3-phosphoshikimate 1-carboxyvinyltransferase